MKNTDSIVTESIIPTFSGSPPVRFAHYRSEVIPEDFFFHLNNHIEIYIYIEGGAKFIVENNVYELTAGDIVLINPREVHKVLLESRGVYERFYLLIDPQTFDAMQIDPIAAISSRLPGESNLLSLPPEKKEIELNLLESIDRSLCRGDSLKAFAYSMLFLDLISEGLSAIKPSRTVKPPRTPGLLKEIFDYVSANAATIESIGEIASAVGRTPQYISGYFSSETGTTLQKYIQAKRIALAKNMLDEGADVTSVCYDCGFNDCSYFIKVFKSYVGMTPFRYKSGVRLDH